MKEIQATWPPYAKTMLEMELNATGNFGSPNAFISKRDALGWTPKAIIVSMTAEKILVKAKWRQHPALDTWQGDLQIIDMKATFLRVLGIVRIPKTTSPTTPHTIVQVA